MSHAHDQQDDAALAYDQQRLKDFLRANIAFLEPDAEIMRDHRMAPRTEGEQRILASGGDPHLYGEIRRFLQGALDDSFEIAENMVVAPAGRFGDMTTAIFTASGDHAMASTRGVIGFCAALHYPIRFVRKYYENDPEVGVHAGDCYLFNDPFYGGMHSPDLSAFSPVFFEGEVVAWTACGLHQGEDGAREPGGMGPAIESPYDEGLKMPPIKMASNYRMRTDVMTFLQNSVRDPRLQGADMKTRLATCVRLEEAIHKAAAEYGRDAVIGALRQNIEFVASEVQRRIRELPPATVRSQIFLDSTMREDALLKLNVSASIRDGKLILDFRGSSPQIANRPINAPLTSLKILMAMSLLCYVWPDLPRVNAVLEHIEVITDPKTIVDATRDVPSALNMQCIFKGVSLVHLIAVKLYFAAPRRYAKMIAPWFNQPVTFIYGGITQNMEMTGNLCADLNGMPGGAHCDSDGEHSLTPNFAAMTDVGESELTEQDLPFLQIISKRLGEDNLGFGKYRSGGGYQTSAVMRGSPFWGFSSIAGGSKFSSVPGLFGGYGCPAYPVAKIKNVNIFDEIKKNPKSFVADIPHLMNERPFEGASYLTTRGAMPFEMCTEGELYMVSQGAGGGYGDVLDRDPHAVIKDVEEGLVSHATARDTFRIVYDENTLALDEEATLESRRSERLARLKRGRPFDEFVQGWNQPAPPEGIPYFGGWGADTATLFANGRSMPADKLEMIFMPDPRDARIAQLEKQLAEARVLGGARA